MCVCVVFVCGVCVCVVCVRVRVCGGGMWYDGMCVVRVRGVCVRVYAVCIGPGAAYGVYGVGVRGCGVDYNVCGVYGACGMCAWCGRCV